MYKCDVFMYKLTRKGKNEQKNEKKWNEKKEVTKFSCLNVCECVYIFTINKFRRWIFYMESSILVRIESAFCMLATQFPWINIAKAKTEPTKPASKQASKRPIPKNTIQINENSIMQRKKNFLKACIKYKGSINGL